MKYNIGKSPFKDRAKAVHVDIDGHRMKKRASLPHDTKREITGVRTSDNTSRPFIFADIQTTGVDEPSRSRPFCDSYSFPLDYPDEDIVHGGTHVKLDEIGTISVRVFLVENWKQRSAGSSVKYKIQDHPPAVINERIKKVGEHCVS